MTVRARHDAVVRSLRRKGTTTVDELAEEVGFSRRTILRDISALRDQGFVIHSEPGRGGGLQLDPQSIQTTARLAVTESLADHCRRSCENGGEKLGHGSGGMTLLRAA